MILGVMESMNECTKCRLSGRMVNTESDKNEPCLVMFVGEAPGAEEEKEQRPFVGASGKILRKLIRKKFRIGTHFFEKGMTNYALTNVIRCHPPHNRDPLMDEMQACDAYLMNDIKTIRPKVIVALGRIAIQRLLGIKTIYEARSKRSVRKEDRGKSRARYDGDVGTTVEYEKKIFGVPVIMIPTYHPSPANKSGRDALKRDFKVIRERWARLKTSR